MKAPSFCCRKTITRLSTIGLSAASPALAARTSSSRVPSCRNIGCCGLPIREPALRQAAEAWNAATGGWGLHLSNPVQRAWRDANAVARHVSLNWDAVGTMYGQHVFGLEPKGQY